MMWMKLILNFCLVVNFFFTVVAFLLLTEP